MMSDITISRPEVVNGHTDVICSTSSPATFWLYERLHCCKSTHLSGNWLKYQQ